jgi:hypothetical protein
MLSTTPMTEPAWGGGAARPIETDSKKAKNDGAGRRDKLDPVI